MALALSAHTEAFAAQSGYEYRTSSEMEIQVGKDDAKLYSEPNETAEIVGLAETGKPYTVLELVDDTWVKVDGGGTEAYLNTEETDAVMAETAKETVIDLSAQKRQEIVKYALQFLGGRYVYGGSNPLTGVDCSGFTAYVMQNAAGITLAHSSRTQATQGRLISVAEARPGDLVFYSAGKRINHVAMYIGDGQVIHASSPKYGIRITALSYRNPVKVVNVLGD